MPIQSPQRVGQTVALRLEVGEFFEGDAAGLSGLKTARLRHHTKSQQRDLKPFLSPIAPEEEVLFNLDSAGIHLFTFDSEPLQIILSADRFHSYLHDEGLDFVRLQREQSGTADQPGRERYRRTIKTLVQAGPNATSDRTYAKSAGQRLELTPLNNPFSLKSGQPLDMKLEFDGKPLGGALVKAWHKRNGQLLTIRIRTGQDGRVKLDLPYTGAWMVSVVHMIPAVDDPNVEWESYWGSLSFGVPARAKQRH